MSDKPHLGSYRGNAFEGSLIKIGPNQLGMQASEWGVVGSKPPDFILEDGDFTADEMAQHHAYWSMLEVKFAAKYLAFKTTPEAAHRATEQVLQATAQYEAIAKAHAEVEAQLTLKQAALAQMAEQHDALVGQVVAMTAQVAAGPTQEKADAA